VDYTSGINGEKESGFSSTIVPIYSYFFVIEKRASAEFISTGPC
jgi:hypothetical protein